MSYHSMHQPQPPMPGFPPQQPPQPPKKSRSNAVIIASAAAVIVAVVATGVALSAGSDGEAKAAPTVTVTKTVSAEDALAADEEPSDPSTPADSAEDGVYALTDTVTYENDIEISLTSFARGVSSDYAVPESTPYAKFTIKIVNNSDSKMDASMLSVSCAYGDEGKEGEAIYDDGLDGSPDTSVLAGRSLSVPWACELPKDETFLQVEVSPDWESEPAIFTGEVK
ncbi:hypothetical protein ACFXAZ_09880 [Streptomyces sp. NPDC059477]|uniref:hypothetical protein n=1 Tax=Streptomyces sp. NPDC059477 TaxID=3346847 RepID=UPI00369439D8